MPEKLPKWLIDAWKGFVFSILAVNLIAIALREAIDTFQKLGLLPFVSIVSGLMILLSITDYVGDFEILEWISEWIEDLFKE